jgi:hypothetical protein
MKTKLLVTALFAFFLTAGVSFSRAITEAKVDQIRAGYTTEAELVRLFGAPITKSTDIYRMTSLTWFQAGGPDPAAYFPIISPFFCNPLRIDVQELSVVLGPDGRVRTWSRWRYRSCR